MGIDWFWQNIPMIREFTVISGQWQFFIDIFRFCKDWDFFHLAAPCHILHIQLYKPPLEICAQKILSHHILSGTGLDH